MPFSDDSEPSDRSPGAVEGESDAVEISAADSLRALVTCVLGWAVPGLGHIASGRVGRGLVFGAVILTMFVGGIVLDGKIYRPEQGVVLSYLATVGGAGVGLPYVIAHIMGLGTGDLRSSTYEYGNTFTLVAGLLNLLVVFDAYDVALGRR